MASQPDFAEYVCPTHGQYRRWRGETECPRCASEKRRRQQETRDAVRKPPPPPFKGQPRVCSLCGDACTGRRRSWCGDDCVKLWFIATSTDAAIGHLLTVFGHRCWQCDATWQPGQLDEWETFGHVFCAPAMDRPGWRGWGAHCRLDITYGPPVPTPVALHRGRAWSTKITDRPGTHRAALVAAVQPAAAVRDLPRGEDEDRGGRPCPPSSRARAPRHRRTRAPAVRLRALMGWPCPLVPEGSWRPQKCSGCGRRRITALVFDLDHETPGAFVDLCGSCFLADGAWSGLLSVTFLPDET